MKKDLQITTEFLTSIKACQEGKDWVEKYTDKEPVAVIKHLVADDKWDWANWLIVRVMDYKQYVSYSVFAAMQTIENFEKVYPDDKRPRLAIEAAQKCIDNPTKENKSAESAARSAARSAAWSAAESAESAAQSAAQSAAWSAESAARSARSEMKTKIINYGISLLKK